MPFIAAVGAGSWIVLMLLVAGLFGYGIARSGRHAVALTALGGALAMILSAATVVVGFIGYSIASAPRSSTQAVESSQLAAATGTDSGTGAVTDAWLHFDSDPGDYIGAGKHQVWTLTESSFTVSGSPGDVRAIVSGQGDDWNLEFRAPSNGSLGTGLFVNAERAPFVTGKAPGLDVSGDGRGCNVLSGRFEIKDVVWSSTGKVIEIDALFDQHCESGRPALRGELWITTRAKVHRTAPAPESTITF